MMFEETKNQKLHKDTRCKGTHCPLKDECKRFVPNFKKSKEVSIVYFASPPFDHELRRCEYFEDRHKDPYI